MTDKRWRGLSALIRDLVVHGSEAVETIQRATLRRPLAVLSAVAPQTVPVTKTIERVHDVAVSTTHRSIRGIARLVDRTIEIGLDLSE